MVKKNTPCPRCGKGFHHKGNLLRHLQKQKLCDPLYIDKSPDEILNNYKQYRTQYTQINNIEKKEVNKLIPKTQKEHKLVLKPKRKYDTAYQEDVEEDDIIINEQPKDKLIKLINESDIKNDTSIQNILMNIVSELSKRGNNVQDSNNITNASNNTNSHNTNTNSNNVYITVNAYENEDLSHMTRKDWNHIIKQKNNAVPELTKKIHLDEPKNHNILIKSLKDGIGYRYNGKTWEMVKLTDLVMDLISLNADRLYDYIENHSVNDSKYHKVVGVLEKIQDQKSKVLKQNVKDVKIMFCNKKDLVLNSHDDPQLEC